MYSIGPQSEGKAVMEKYEEGGNRYVKGCVIIDLNYFDVFYQREKSSYYATVFPGDYLGGEAYWAGGLHLYTPLPFRPGKGGFGDLFRTHFFLNAGNLCNLNYGGCTENMTSPHLFCYDELD